VFVETLLNSNTGTVFQMNILITLSKGQSKCQFLTIAANLYLMGKKLFAGRVLEGLRRIQLSSNLELIALQRFL
jgi:hypothetical protein